MDEWMNEWMNEWADNLPSMYLFHVLYA